MTKYKCSDCGQEYDDGLEACPNCGCPTVFQSIQSEQSSPTIITCVDCRQEYDSQLEACPNCGCPTASQAPLSKQTSQSSYSNKQKASKGNNKKRFLLWGLLVVILGIILTGVIYYYGHSNEIKIARYEKIAAKYKAALGDNCCILSETIDSITQKVFFYEKETAVSEKYGIPMKDIKVHDYATGETCSILPSTATMEDFELCGMELKDSKLIEDRLFLMIHSTCVWKLDATGVFYIDIRDNSLHYVESCDEAEFKIDDEICIHKYYCLEVQRGDEAEYREYYLSALLSDEDYADNRENQKELEGFLAAEWRKEEEVKRVKGWLIGMWEWSGIVWGNRVWVRMSISDNNIVCFSSDGVLDQGSYSIDTENQIIHFGRYSYAKYDKRQRIYADDGEPYRKISNNPSYSTSNSGSAVHNGSNKTGSYGSRGGNSITNQLEKLDNEESQIISVVDPIRRSGQFYPDILVKVMRMKQINDERIRLARQQGDRDLILYYELQKTRSEAIIKQWGF